jgi:hypothetical protein
VQALVGACAFLEENLTMMKRVVGTSLVIVVCGVGGVSSAYAQATRTWVSGVGDDANPCSRTAPCKTFAGAISKTAAGGEISVLDPGGFGGVTITKSITINGEGTLAGLLVSGTNGIVINASPTDNITLRHLSIVAPGNGLNGISLLQAGRLRVESSTIEGFTQSGISVASAADASVAVVDTKISRAATGVKVGATAARVLVSLNNVSITGTSTAIDTLGGVVTVSKSVIAQNSAFGVLAQAGAITVEDSMLTGNGVAVQAQPSGTVRLSNNGVYDNLTGFGCGGGTLASTGNNRKANNTGGGVPSCAPNATVTVQ